MHICSSVFLADSHLFLCKSFHPCVHCMVNSIYVTIVLQLFYLYVFCCFVSYFLCLNILFDVSAPTILQYGLQQLCWIPTCGTYVIHIHYRRRIYTEEKEKVVAAVWRPTLLNFLLFALGWYEENDEFILFFTSSMQVQGFERILCKSCSYFFAKSGSRWYDYHSYVY